MTELLTFDAGGTVYAVPVAQVREILDQAALTRLPQMPEGVVGVINLRGKVVPVVDLRQRLGLAGREGAGADCIIVLDLQIDATSTVMGIMVDGAREVMTLAAADIEPPPRFGRSQSSELLAGLGKRDGQFVIILRPEHLLAAGEALSFSGLHRVEAGAAAATEC